MGSLNEKIYARIVNFSKKGDSLLKQGSIKEAIFEYVQALRLLPKPIHDWEAATWLFTAIGDAYWAIKDYKRAYEAFQSALRSPGGIGNAFVHLRMGQLHYELGNRTKAKDDLLRAYMAAGKEIFEGEDQKYFQAIVDVI